MFEDEFSYENKAFEILLKVFTKEELARLCRTDCQYIIHRDDWHLILTTKPPNQATVQATYLGQVVYRPRNIQLIFRQSIYQPD